MIEREALANRGMILLDLEITSDVSGCIASERRSFFTRNH
jgi:hypothetical protein